MIYVNSANESNTAPGRLMHDFHCRNAAGMYSPILAKRMQTLKETPEEVEKMCQEMQKIREDGLREGREEGRVEGREEGRLEVIKKTVLVMHQNGLSDEEIVNTFSSYDIDPAQVRKWMAEAVPA